MLISRPLTQIWRCLSATRIRMTLKLHRRVIFVQCLSQHITRVWRCLSIANMHALYFIKCTLTITLSTNKRHGDRCYERLEHLATLQCNFDTYYRHYPSKRHLHNENFSYLQSSSWGHNNLNIVYYNNRSLR